MQPIVKDTKKDVARPAHPDTHSKSTGEHSADDRLNKMADNMAGRGREHQREGDRDIIADSDPHGRD